MFLVVGFRVKRRFFDEGASADEGMLVFFVGSFVSESEDSTEAFSTVLPAVKQAQSLADDNGLTALSGCVQARTKASHIMP
jgi:hypothetical protein